MDYVYLIYVGTHVLGVASTLDVAKRTVETTYGGIGFADEWANFPRGDRRHTVDGKDIYITPRQFLTVPDHL